MWHRQIFVILLLFAFAMFTCRACNRSFTRPQALRTHQHYCKSSANVNRSAAQGLQTLRYTRESKLPRIEGGRDEKDIRHELRETLNEVRNCALFYKYVLINTQLIDDSAQAGPSNSTEIVEPAIPEIVEEPIYLRSGRKRKIPKAYKDYLPSGFRGIPLTVDLGRLVPPTHIVEPHPPTEIENTIDLPITPELNTTPYISTRYETQVDEFGLYRQYTREPRSDPSELLSTPENLVDSLSIQTPLSSLPSRNPLCALGHNTAVKATEWFAPFTSATEFHIMNWQYSGSQMKSGGELDRLVNNVLLADDFKHDDLKEFSARRAEQQLDNYHEPSGIFSKDDGWREASVTIPLPKEDTKFADESAAPTFEVNGLWYRPLRDVIKSAYEDVSQCEYHNIPHKVFHTSTTSGNPKSAESERVYSEIYDSDAMLEEQAKLDELPRNPDDDANVEYVVAPLMAYSDATHLADFGSASLWPFYLFFGSSSKYTRGKPSRFAAHHLAYAPKVSSHLYII